MSVRLEGTELPIETGTSAARFVRMLGKHRYVAGRVHLVHAFVVDAACAHGGDPALAEASAWARAVLADASIEKTSKDERLYRQASDAELAAVLEAHWTPGDRRNAARGRLSAALEGIGVAFDPAALPFDEGVEEDVFPVLVDAGWELVPLTALDRERHRGAIEAFDDTLAYDVARFEEENHVPPVATLHELPLLGPTELLGATDENDQLRAPFVLWASGNETYLDYVLRGVLRAAMKI